jgi:hypothetical protein
MAQPDEKGQVFVLVFHRLRAWTANSEYPTIRIGVAATRIRGFSVRVRGTLASDACNSSERPVCVADRRHRNTPVSGRRPEAMAARARRVST